MSKIFGSQTKTTKTKAPFESAPWEKQQPYLKTGFSQGKEALTGALSGIEALPDNMTAGFTQGQTQDMQAISDAGRAFASGPAQTIQQGGVQAMGAGTGPMVNPELNRSTVNASGIIQSAQDPSITQAAGSIAAQAGGNAGYGSQVQQMATDGPAGIRAGDIYADAAGGPTNSRAGDVYADVNADKTGQVVNNAGQYAANPFLDGQIDAATRDVARAFQMERGNINSAASGSGGINSTRAGTLEAYAARDAMDRAGDIASGMRSDAYKTGVATAANMENLRQGSTLGANNQLQGDDSYRQTGMLAANAQDLTGKGIALEGVLGAGNQNIADKGLTIDGQLGAGQLALGDKSTTLDAMLGGNAQLGQNADRREVAANNGIDRFGAAAGIAGSGYEMGRQGSADSLAMGDAQQQQQQKEIEGALLKAGLPLEMVSQYMAAIGGNFGQKGFQTNVSTSESPSIFNQITGAASSLMGGFGALSKPG
jgi:hypothetical protein